MTGKGSLLTPAKLSPIKICSLADLSSLVYLLFVCFVFLVFTLPQSLLQLVSDCFFPWTSLVTFGCLKDFTAAEFAGSLTSSFCSSVASRQVSIQEQDGGLFMLATTEIRSSVFAVISSTFSSPFASSRDSLNESMIPGRIAGRVFPSKHLVLGELLANFPRIVSS
jgi:hypothetical protein